MKKPKPWIDCDVRCFLSRLKKLEYQLMAHVAVSGHHLLQDRVFRDLDIWLVCKKFCDPNPGHVAEILKEEAGLTLKGSERVSPATWSLLFEDGSGRLVDVLYFAPYGEGIQK